MKKKKKNDKPKAKKISWKTDIKRNWQIYVIFLPAFLFFLVLSYIPMFGIVMAFENFKVTKGFLGSQWIGLDNFKYLLVIRTFICAAKYGMYRTLKDHGWLYCTDHLCRIAQSLVQQALQADRADTFLSAKLYRSRCRMFPLSGVRRHGRSIIRIFCQPAQYNEQQLAGRQPYSCILASLYLYGNLAGHWLGIHHVCGIHFHGQW